MNSVEFPALKLFLGKNVVSTKAATAAGRRSVMCAIRKEFIAVKFGTDSLEITPRGRQRLMALVEECETLIKTHEVDTAPAVTLIDVRIYDDNSIET